MGMTHSWRSAQVSVLQLWDERCASPNPAALGLTVCQSETWADNSQAADLSRKDNCVCNESQRVRTDLPEQVLSPPKSSFLTHGHIYRENLFILQLHLCIEQAFWKPPCAFTSCIHKAFNSQMAVLDTTSRSPWRRAPSSGAVVSTEEVLENSS